MHRWELAACQQLNGCLIVGSCVPRHPVVQSVSPESQLTSLSSCRSSQHGCSEHSHRSSCFSRPQRGLGRGPGASRSVKAAAGAQSAILKGETHNRSNLPDHPPVGNPERPLSLIPASHTKVIHFVRHAQGFHNIGFEANEDAHLTPFGWRQTQALKLHLSTLEPALRPQVIIVSPLTRTLETASGVFGAGSLDKNRLDPIMMPTGAEPNVCSKHDAIAKPSQPPFVACELCRERIGPNPCDRRKSLALTKKQFPGVDFSLIKTDKDILWDKLNLKPTSGGIYPLGESEQEVEQRGMEFLQWLMERPESRIAVVSHAGFLRHTLANFASGTQLDDSLIREFNNCELRTMYLSGGSQPKGFGDTTQFLGGTSWLHEPRFQELSRSKAVV